MGIRIPPFTKNGPEQSPGPFQCVDFVYALKIFARIGVQILRHGRVMRREGASWPAPSQIPAAILASLLHLSFM